MVEFYGGILLWDEKVKRLEIFSFYLLVPSFRLVNENGKKFEWEDFGVKLIIRYRREIMK